MACRGASPTDRPSSWVEVRFGRHAIDAPPELLARHKTEFELGLAFGLETSDFLLLEQQWEVLMSEAEENVKRYAGSDDNHTDAQLHLYEIGGAQVMVSEKSTPWSRNCDVNVLLRHGETGLLVHHYHPDDGGDVGLREVELFLSNLEPLPSTRTRRNPYYTPHFEIDREPGLSQRIEVLLEAVDGRFLSLESALVRGREHLDMGGALMVRADLWSSRREYKGTGTPNQLRRSILRRAGEMTGSEYAWTTDSGEGGRLNFVWVHLGRAHDVKRPYMVILYSGDLAHSEAATLRREWRQIVASLRSLPQTALTFGNKAI